MDNEARAVAVVRLSFTDYRAYDHESFFPAVGIVLGHTVIAYIEHAQIGQYREFLAIVIRQPFHVNAIEHLVEVRYRFLIDRLSFPIDFVEICLVVEIVE